MDLYRYRMFCIFMLTCGLIFFWFKIIVLSQFGFCFHLFQIMAQNKFKPHHNRIFRNYGNSSPYLIECQGPVGEWMSTELQPRTASQISQLDSQIDRLVEYKINLYSHMASPRILKVKSNVQLLGDLLRIFSSYLHNCSTCGGNMCTVWEDRRYMYCHVCAL